MLPIINLTLNRNFKIRNFEEDKNATLSANPGLRYVGNIGNIYKFTGNYYLLNDDNKLIESFEIEIYIDKTYPFTIPIVYSTDEKIERSEEYHISQEGKICFEHTYIENYLITKGIRLYDFINYFFKKYFSWVLVKKFGRSEDLQEWAHGREGSLQVYETLLNINDKTIIKIFLEKFINTPKIDRNHKCYCGSGEKIKNCHYEALLFLKSTPKNILRDDISFINNELPITPPAAHTNVSENQ